MSATVFYFSGTGNSLVVARSLAEKLEDAKLIGLASLPSDRKLVVDSDTVAFVFPVYSAGLPVIVKKSLDRIKFSGSPYICAIDTCGGSAGIAVGLFAEELAAVCGKKLASGWELVMPSNYTPLYGAFSDRVNERLLNSASSRLQHLTGLIQARQSARLETTPAPFSWPMKVVWRGFASWVPRSDRHFRAAQACTGCGICATVCPANNILLNNACRPVWQRHCEQCMACLQFCPVEAIQFCWWTKGRRRYHHPQVTPADIASQK